LFPKNGTDWRCPGQSTQDWPGDILLPDDAAMVDTIRPARPFALSKGRAEA
jgi:hypothetical protein